MPKQTIELIYIPSQGAPFRWTGTPGPRMTVADAIAQSRLYEQHPETIHWPVGIFSTQVDPSTELNPGDRIEIYRPLTLNPMEKRRKRQKNTRV